MLGRINIVSRSSIWRIILVMLTCRDQQAAACKGIRKIECIVFFSILHFPGVADTAFPEHQRTALAAVQLGGEQIAFPCLMTGRGLFIFRQLLLYFVEQVRVCAARWRGLAPTSSPDTRAGIALGCTTSRKRNSPMYRRLLSIR